MQIVQKGTNNRKQEKMNCYNGVQPAQPGNTATLHPAAGTVQTQAIAAQPQTASTTPPVDNADCATGGATTGASADDEELL